MIYSTHKFFQITCIILQTSTHFVSSSYTDRIYLFSDYYYYYKIRKQMSDIH